MFDDADLKTIGELIDQGIQTFAQSHGVISGASKQASETVMADVGSDERYKKQGPSESSTNYMNTKRTYDAYLGVDLEALGRNRLSFDKMITAAQGHTERMYTLSEQALENSIQRDNLVNNNSAQRSNLVNNQAAAHRDIATNEQWNLSEQNFLIAQALKNAGVDSSVIAEIMDNMVTE